MSIGSFYKQSAKDGMITLQPSAGILMPLRTLRQRFPKRRQRPSGVPSTRLFVGCARISPGPSADKSVSL